MKPTPKQIFIARGLAWEDSKTRLKDQYLPTDTKRGPIEGEPPQTTAWRLYLSMARRSIRDGERFEKEEERRRQMLNFYRSEGVSGFRGSVYF